MNGLVPKFDTWHPVTASEPKPDTDPRSKPLDFPLASAEVLALRRPAQFGRPSVKGLDVHELTLADLSSAELLLLAGGDR